jgi:HEPN domain-containing protein
MSRKRYPPDDPREWLNRARGNLVRARAKTPGMFLEDLCFDAQQCAEKAVFVSRRETFPFIHSLKRLLDLLEQNGVKIPKYVWETEKLTPYAAVMRYPGEMDSVTPREYRREVRIAAAVLGRAAGRRKPRQAGKEKVVARA